MREQVEQIGAVASGPAGLGAIPVALGAAGLAGSRVAAGLTAVVAGRADGTMEAARFEAQWNNFDKENLLVTKVNDLREAWQGLKVEVGQGFLPDVKEATGMLTNLVDNIRGGVKE